MKRILWETYFDETLPRSRGRRASKRVRKEDIIKALNSLSLSYVVSESRYPRTPWKIEKKFEVEWDGSKEELIKKIENRISSETSEIPQEHQ